MKLLSIFSIAAFSIAMAGCGENNKPAGKPKSKGPDTVLVIRLGKDSVAKTIQFPAELLPLERAELFAKVNGYVKTMRADIGDRVAKGQVLATLEAPELLYNVSQSEADVQQARSKLMASKDTYERLVNASRTQGAISPSELQRAMSQMMADSAAMSATMARTGSASQIRDYLVIRAPFSGIITQRNADPGTLVGAGASGPLFVIENSSSLRLRIPIPEAYTSANIEGSAISFFTDANPALTYTANLSRKSGSLNVQNRTESWEFIYPNKNKELMPGMYVTASLPLARSGKSFVVPASSVATNQEKKFVIRVREGKLEWVDVRTGISMKDALEIFGPLQEGDVLLKRATDEKKPGTAVITKMEN